MNHDIFPYIAIIHAAVHNQSHTLSKRVKRRDFSIPTWYRLLIIYKPNKIPFSQSFQWEDENFKNIQTNKNENIYVLILWCLVVRLYWMLFVFFSVLRKFGKGWHSWIMLFIFWIIIDNTAIIFWLRNVNIIHFLFYFWWLG